MKTGYLIAVEEFCAHHNIAISFVSSLQQNGLIKITTVKNAEFIDADQLLQLEKYLRFYFELDINMEGIETITHLLQRVHSLQNEIITLRNRLRIYETEI